MVIGGGGDDVIYGGNTDGSDASKGQNPAPSNILVGDGERLDDGDPATVDPLSADVNFSVNLAFVGGNDTLNGADASTNNMYGDAVNVNMLTGSSFQGGMDELIGGDGVGVNNLMFGDAENVTTLSGTTFTGGNDTLRAGNDTGFAVSNRMFGDTQIIGGDGEFKGGNDTLFSGNGNDTMVGDWSNDNGFDFVNGTATGGIDTFVFAQNFGSDSIADFESSADNGGIAKDQINLNATGLVDFSDLDSNGNNVLDGGIGGDAGVTINSGNTQIDFGVVSIGAFQGFLTVTGEVALVAGDFDFDTVLV
jgi:hypothetical protein